MNYSIPKDARILVNVCAVGRDPDAWEDPLTFNPSRFLNNDLDFKGNDFELIPFSAGKRTCPGIPLAAKLIPLIVASMVHSFDWYLPNHICSTALDMNEKFGITLLKEQPLLLIPKIRKL
ncbi:Cytochrome p450 [Thalictrum thalictroides]|uniref:Cytochrome p450 n=1 Tax=Thalictrum thalictroides TaxID=46969 RepID=A0A7J6W733_THATH|nr:Cytochrome p450 [Thalictrum thalictroides]